jgi:hypothetical protein
MDDWLRSDTVKWHPNDLIVPHFDALLGEEDITSMDKLMSPLVTASSHQQDADLGGLEASNTDIEIDFEVPGPVSSVHLLSAIT